MTNPLWEDFARREPFFAIVPTESHRRANLTSETEAAFFAEGAARVDWVFQAMTMIAPDFEPMSALDFGCGIGRLALPLATRTKSVIAVDDSPALLAHACEFAANQGATNVAFQNPAELDASTRKFDLVICDAWLQRQAPGAGLARLRALVTRLGPGGIGAIRFPYHDDTTGPVRWLRALREQIPAFNSLFNTLRGTLPDPFIPTHVYATDQILSVLREASITTCVFTSDPHAIPPNLTVLFRAPLSTAPAIRKLREPIDDAETFTAASNAAFIDVRDVIANTSIEELNRTAEEYFSTLTNWDHHLTKPFAGANDTPNLLIDAARLIQGLHLTPGTRVLEFGSGSGWLSRWITQLGCRAVLLDVSPTSLNMARELYKRQPVIGDQPPPEFVLFDGRRIDLPDSSVDRIISFHAFHHATNPHEVIREFARVLAPGGIAAFAEPGPRHSRTPLSQFEMRTYAVVENDIDIHAIWETAQAAGFADLRLLVYHLPPYYASLTSFEDLLTGGAENDAWAASTRVFLRNRRTFFLTKAGGARLDSRRAEGLACKIGVDAPSSATTGERIAVDVTISNIGKAVWLPWGQRGGVAIGAHLLDESGALLNFDFHCESPTQPPREIQPGETVQTRMSLPPLPSGRYRLEFDCVAAEVTWFAQVGSRTVVSAIAVR